jgi:hypothetical protein
MQAPESLLRDCSSLDSSKISVEKAMEFRSLLATWLPGKQFTLIYRGTRDGMTAEAFHRCCDAESETLIIVRARTHHLFSKNEYFVFGGYASAPWVGSTLSMQSSSFLFVIKNSHESPVSQLKIARRAGLDSVLVYTNGAGPVFEGGFSIAGPSASKSFDKSSRCTVRKEGCFGDPLGLGVSTFTPAENFEPREVEVYRVFDVEVSLSSRGMGGVYPFTPVSVVNPSPASTPATAPVVAASRFPTSPADSSSLLASDSFILWAGQARAKEFEQKLRKWLPAKRFQLLYRGSRDGMTPAAFHGRCDNLGPTLVLVRHKSSVFGGYAGKSWVCPPGKDPDFIDAPDSFLFNISNPYNDPITKMPINTSSSFRNWAMVSDRKDGPHFHSGFSITADSPTGTFSGLSKCDITPTWVYGDPLGRGHETFTGEWWFTPDDVEVYRVV